MTRIRGMAEMVDRKLCGLKNSSPGAPGHALRRRRSNLLFAHALRTALALILLFLLSSVSAQAGISLVQTINGSSSSSTSVSATFASTPTQNNLLVAIAGNYYASTAPATPSGWSVAINETNNDPGQVIYYKIAGASEGSTVTVSGYEPVEG